jgi:hypothetical protein
MNKIRVNVATQTDVTKVRTEQRNGRTVLIVPSKTLPDNIVMKGVMYPAEEIAKSYKTLEGTQAPFGHPMVDGQYVNALHPAALNSAHIGAHNENVRQENGVVLLDKVIDVDVAERTEQGRAVLNAINKGDPIHTSTGLVYDPEDAPKGSAYKTIARNMLFDHDCILIGEAGAATPAQGVGMMVNALLDGSEVEKREQLTEGLRALAPMGEGWYYLQDYNAAELIFEFEGEQTGGVTSPAASYATAYTFNDSGVLVLSSEYYPVKRVSTWERAKSAVIKLVTVNKSNPKEAVSMTPEEMKAALDAHTESIKSLLAENTASIGEQLTAVNTAVAELGAIDRKQADVLTAANRAAVESVHGKVIADALDGEALEAMAAKCQSSAAVPLIGTNSAESLTNTLPE